MKRRDLEKKLRLSGCYLKREGKIAFPVDKPQNGDY